MPWPCRPTSRTLFAARSRTRALDRFGRLDIVVNNAAVIRPARLTAVTPELFDHHYAVNVRGPLLLVKAALPALRRSPDAAIVNVSSSVGSIVKPGNMLVRLDQSRSRVPHQGVGLRAGRRPDPGQLYCAWSRRHPDPRHLLDRPRRHVCRPRPPGPLQRMGDVDDVATWVCLLVAAETAWTTGNVIHVDGGQVLGIPASSGG